LGIVGGFFSRRRILKISLLLAAVVDLRLRFGLHVFLFLKLLLTSRGSLPQQ